MILARGSGTCQKWTGVRVAGWGDVGPEAGVEALEEITGVVVQAERGDGDLAGMSLNRVVSSREPKIV